MWSTAPGCEEQQTHSSASPSAVRYLPLQPQRDALTADYWTVRDGVVFPSTGDVHVGMVDRGGQLEVEVNQARGLTPKPGSKNIPGTVYGLHLLQ